MKDKIPKEFNKEVVLGNYVYNVDENGHAYIPRNSKDFSNFIAGVYHNVKNPTIEQQVNFILITSYPFLLPKSEVYEGLDVFGLFPYDFMWTQFDNIPEGWRERFGYDMLSEIRDVLEEESSTALYDYDITDVKEKYGGLRWYDNGISNKVASIVDKYEKISYQVCMVCGRNKEDQRAFTCDSCSKKNKYGR